MDNEGVFLIRGCCYNHRYIWMVCGIYLFQIDRLNGEHRETVNIPVSFLEGVESNLTMYERNESVFLISEKKSRLCIVDFGDKSTTIIDKGLPESEDSLWIVTDEGEVIVFSVFHADLFICKRNGNVEKRSSFREALLEEINKFGLQYIHIRGHASFLNEECIVLIVKTNVNDCVCVIDARSFCILRVMILDERYKNCYGIGYFDGALWLQSVRNSVSYIIKKDINNQMKDDEWRLTYGFGKCKYLSKNKKGIVVVSNSGNIGIISYNKRDIDMVLVEQGMPFSISMNRIYDEFLVRKGLLISVIDANELTQMAVYSFAGIPNLSDFLKRIISNS